jgi:hypothetical protein
VNHYRVLPQPAEWNTWLPGDPTLTDGSIGSEWDFRTGDLYHGTVEVTTLSEGVRTGISPDLPLVSLEMLRIVDDLLLPSEVQRVPVIVDGMATRYVLLNVLQYPDCIDHESVYGERLPADDECLPNHYKMVIPLRILEEKTANLKIFRPYDFRNALVVSEDFKERVEMADLVSGVVFQQV